MTESNRDNGPPMQRGVDGDGKPWMGTMRDVLEDYKTAANVEARLGDEARADAKRLREGVSLMVRERIAVYPADAPRTDWYGQIFRRRAGRKGSDSWGAYAPTPIEAVEAVYAEFMRQNTGADHD